MKKFRRSGLVRSRAMVLGLVLVALGAAGIALLAYSTGALDRQEGDTVDQRFALRGTEERPDVVVVAIDHDTIVGLERQWPYPRSWHGRVIDRLRRAGARQIAVDIQFSEPSADTAQDLALYDAAGRAGHVVFATDQVSAQGEPGVFDGWRSLRPIHATGGHSFLPTSSGGVGRHIVYSEAKLKTLAVTAVEAATRRPVARSAFEHGAWIDFGGPPGTVRTVSYADVLHGRVAPSVFRGKIVVVGATEANLHDLHPTSTSGNGVMPGPEIQANAMWTILHGFPLRDAPPWLALALIVALAVLAPLLSLRFRPLAVVPAALAALALFLVGGQLAFDGGTVVPIIYPALGLVLGLIGMVVVVLSAEIRARQRTRTLFSRFVPEAVVGDLLDRMGGELRLGGERQVATVMFCDLRGFTRFAERLPAEQVIDVLNRYLTGMSDAILDNGGTLVSYMGDGIMAIFGAPIARPDHADAAFAAAREMLERRLIDFNAWLRAEGLGDGFRMGIGLNSGPVMSGNVGSERRLEYAAIGDTTNVASRLEGMTKRAGVQLLVADSTRELMTGQTDGLVCVGPQEVTGRDATIIAWTLASEAVGVAEPAPTGPGDRVTQPA